MIIATLSLLLVSVGVYHFPPPIHLTKTRLTRRAKRPPRTDKPHIKDMQSFALYSSIVPVLFHAVRASGKICFVLVPPCLIFGDCETQAIFEKVEYTTNCSLIKLSSNMYVKIEQEHAFPGNEDV